MKCHHKFTVRTTLFGRWYQFHCSKCDTGFIVFKSGFRLAMLNPEFKMLDFPVSMADQVEHYIEYVQFEEGGEEDGGSGERLRPPSQRLGTAEAVPRGSHTDGGRLVRQGVGT